MAATELHITVEEMFEMAKDQVHPADHWRLWNHLSARWPFGITCRVVYETPTIH